MNLNFVRAGMEEALVHRCDPTSKLTDAGRQFVNMSLLDLCREHLQRHGVTTSGMSRMEVAGNAMRFRNAMTTSDFSSLLANVASKRMRSGYEESMRSYKVWARRAADAQDFKPMSVVNLSAMPDLLVVNEAGEFKYGAVQASGESYSLMTYGRLLAFTRQAIVNDDLRAFDRVAFAFGLAAGRLENRTVYAQLTANAPLSDGVALFHATHSNLGTGAGSALSTSALAEARRAMRVQRGLNSEEINIAPAYLIVPAALEQSAYQLTSAQYVPARTSDVNEFREGGRSALQPVVEPLLDAVSPLQWYAAAASRQVDTVEYCYLSGATEPHIESRVGFTLDAVEFKCRHDFAAKAIDHRGLYRANGS